MKNEPVQALASEQMLAWTVFYLEKTNIMDLSEQRCLKGQQKAKKNFEKPLRDQGKK